MHNVIGLVCEFSFPLAFQCLVEKFDVEAHIVADDDVVSDPFHEFVDGDLFVFAALHFLLANACKLLDFLRYGPFLFHQSVVFFDVLSDFNGSDFNDAVVDRVESRGLKVEDDIG